MSADLQRQNRCPNCGTLNRSDSRFCLECGEPLEKGQMQTASRTNTQGYQQPKEEKSKNTMIIAAIVAAVAIVFVIGVVIALTVLGSGGKKKITEQKGLQDAEEWTENVVTANSQADIDAVNNRNCTLQGTIYYTDNSELPVLILKEAQSVYLNSTTGEQILYNSVSSVSISSYPITNTKMKRYNNVEVAVAGTLWADDDVIYMDADDIFGEPKEETEKKESKAVTVSSDSDYILPDSDKKYLTNSDISGLSLREINYAKNEIYARHGRKFDSRELREYFESKDWYYGYVSPSDFSTKVFNKYENSNIQFLNKRENELGVYQLDQ